MEYTYEDEIRITSEFLDKIDILSYLPPNKSYDINDLREALENDYENNYHGLSVPHDDFFEGCLFNRMNEEEFRDYLAYRYRTNEVYFNDVTTTYIKKVVKQ